MTDHPRPDDLADLRATVATLQGEVRRLQRRRRLPRRLLPVLLAALLVALVPLATLAANPFNDLNPNSVHNPNIDALYAAGITTGCDPNVAYCPNDKVTREEMASFLARTAGLGGNPPVANAKTAQTATNATNATNAQNAASATNANAVDGKSANELVRAARGSSENVTSALAFTAEESLTVVAPAPGFVLVNAAVSPATGGAASCPCQFHLRIVHGGVESPIQVQTIAAASATASMANTWVFPVGAGPQTFQMQIAKSAGVPAAYRNPTLTAIYVPFGASGGATLAP